MRPFLLVPLLAWPLAACEVPPPSITRADIADFNSRAEIARNLPITPVADLPVGTVSYFGAFGSNADVEGVGDALLGEMDMRVNFFDQNIDGRLFNINLIEGGTPQQRMSGELALDGRAVNGRVRAEATGTITRIDVGRIDYSDVVLFLDGNVRDDAFVGDAVAGRIGGYGEGSFDFVLDGTGQFYGVAEQ